MKSILKIFMLSVVSTFLIIALIFLIGYLFNTPTGLHITYPIRVLRGTQNYVGETRGVEVAFIWERIILPFIFLSSAVVLTFFRKKLRLS
jgi:hypothetical protein